MDNTNSLAKTLDSSLNKQAIASFAAKNKASFASDTVRNVFDSLQIEEVLIGEITTLTPSGSDPYQSGSVNINYKNQQRSRPPQVLVFFNGQFLPIFSSLLDSSLVFSTTTYAVANAYRTKVSITFYGDTTYTAPLKFLVYVLKDKLGKR